MVGTVGADQALDAVELVALGVPALCAKGFETHRNLPGRRSDSSHSRTHRCRTARRRRRRLRAHRHRRSRSACRCRPAQRSGPHRLVPSSSFGYLSSPLVPVIFAMMHTPCPGRPGSGARPLRKCGGRSFQSEFMPEACTLTWSSKQKHCIRKSRTRRAVKEHPRSWIRGAPRLCFRPNPSGSTVRRLRCQEPWYGAEQEESVADTNDRDDGLWAPIARRSGLTLLELDLVLGHARVQRPDVGRAGRRCWKAPSQSRSRAIQRCFCRASRQHGSSSCWTVGSGSIARLRRDRRSPSPSSAAATALRRPSSCRPWTTRSARR